MKSSMDPFLLSGLDIGTKKITVIVAEKDPKTSDILVVCTGIARSKGIRKGDILDHDLMVESIREATDKAESIIGLPVPGTVISIGPSKVNSVVLNHSISLRKNGDPDRPVTSADMKDVVEEAIDSAMQMSEDCLLHAIPVKYSVDHDDGLDDPRGYKGSELSVEMLAIFVPERSIAEAVDCARKAGLDVVGVIHKSVSAALGSLSKEEMEKGSVAVDIGAGTSSMTYVHNGIIKGVDLVPVGGDHVTNDISQILGISASLAEMLKREVSLVESEESLCDELEFDEEEETFVATAGDVLDIIYPRIEEILVRFIDPGIKMISGTGKLASLVFSGGVTRSLGFGSVIDDLFDLPVRIGEPLDSNSLPPQSRGSEFTSPLGIIHYIFEKERKPDIYLEPSCHEMLGEKEGVNTIGDIIREPRRIFTGGINRPERTDRFAALIQAVKHAFKELF